MKTSEFIPPLSARAIIYYDNMSRVSFPLLSSARLKWIIAALVILLLPLSQVSAADITVGTNCTLAQAITSANSNTAPGGSSTCTAGSSSETDIITLTGDVSLTAALPNITSAITIEGKGYEVKRASSASAFRIFSVRAGATMIINDLTITGGLLSQDDDAGGGIFVIGGSLTLNRSAVHSNQSNGFGGGIATARQSGTTLTINESAIINNTAGVNGGGIANAGSSTSIRNSTIYGNTAKSGGGIFIDAGTVTLTHVTMAGNKGTGSPGLRVNHTSAVVRLRNSILADTAGGSDCSLISGASLAEITNSIIKDGSCGAPSTASVDPKLGVLTKNRVPWFPLLVDSPAIDALDAADAHCPPIDQRGQVRPQGDSCDIGAREFSVTDITVGTGCTLAQAITAANTDSTPSGSTCEVGSDADIITLTGDVLLTAALPEITSAITIEGKGYTVRRFESASAFRIFRTGATVIINDLIISGGSTSQDDAAGGGILVTGGSLTLNRSTVQSNQSNGYGGGIATANEPGITLTINESAIINNTAGVNGGGIANAGSSTSIRNSTIYGNTAKSGGGIFIDAGTVTLTHVTMAGNKGTGSPGLRVNHTSAVVRLRNSILADTAGGSDCSLISGASLAEITNSIIKDGSCGAPSAASVDPRLGVLLRKHKIPWIPLRVGSPAIDAIDAADAHCPDTDQRGQARPFGEGCDIGAREFTVANITVGEGCTLAQAITSANTDSAPSGSTCVAGIGADTITLTEDVLLTAALPDIETAIIIEGAGYEVKRDPDSGRFRVFTLDVDADVIMNDLIITGGYPSDTSGGGILLKSGRLTLNRSAVHSNRAPGIGGGISAIGARSDHASITINESSITNNSVVDNGGGISIDTIPASIRNSTIQGNSAFNGGGIYIHTSASVTLTHVTMAGNGGDGSPGLKVNHASVVLRLRNSILADTVDGSDCSLPTTPAGAALAEITNSIIKDGSCGAPSAASIDPKLGALTEDKIPWVPLLAVSPAINAIDPADAHCPDTDQRGTPRPQGDACDIGAYEFPISQQMGPVGIITVDEDCSLYQAIKAAVDVPAGLSPAPDTGNCEEPAIGLNARNTIILPRDGWTTLTDGSLNINQARIPPITIEVNNHTINGGNRYPVFILCNDVNVTIKNLIMINGKAISTDGNTTDGNTEGNVAGDEPDRNCDGMPAGNGGGIAVAGTLTLENSVIRNSSATGSGGGIYSKNSVVAINNSVISGNVSDRGGGVYADVDVDADADEIEMTIDNSSVTGNSAKDSGGGIYIRGGMAAIRNKSVLAGNMADGEGGAVYVNEAIELLLENSVLKNSYAGRNGGGIHAASSIVTINDSVIQTSSAERNGGGISIVTSTARIKNSAISGNTASSAGGVFVGEGGWLGLEDSTISDNSATAPTGVGGGVFGSYFQTMAVNRSAIARNQATLQGGGIMLERGKAPMIMANSTIYENKTNAITGEGGGIFVRDGIAVFNHLTLAYNEAGPRRGGGIFKLEAAEVHLQNSIIAGSIGGDCGARVSQDGQSPGRLDTNEYNIIQDGSCSTPRVFTRDPMLGRLASTAPAYFPLRPGSFAIDIIDTDSAEQNCPADQLGRERPVGKACDIGAVEFVPPPPRPSPAEDDDEEEEEPTPPKPPVNTCLTLPESIRVRPGTGGVQCQRVAEAATVGNQTVIDAGLIDAVDVWGWMGYGVEVCFRNHHNGILLFLDAATAPRSLSALPLHTATDMTCSFIDSPGTIALVHQPSTPSVQAALAAGLQDCKVSTTAIVNFRDGPGGNLIMGFIDPRGDRIDGWLPQGVTLTALARTQKWFKVDYHGNIGWISADYVIPQGSCDEGSGLRAAGA